MWGQSRSSRSGEDGGTRSVLRPRPLRGKVSSRARILLWATLASLIFGAIEFGEPLDYALRNARNMIRRHDVSGQIVVVGIDTRSLDAVGDWPWRGQTHAELIRALKKSGTRKILFDVESLGSRTPSDVASLQQALRQPGAPVILGISSMSRSERTRRPSNFAKEFEPLMGFANIDVRTNFLGSATKLYFGRDIKGTYYPSFSARLASVTGTPEDLFAIDYAYDPNSVPTISAADVLAGQAEVGALAGKDVIVGLTAPLLGDHHYTPHYGDIPGVYLHAIGAETLKSGRPRDFGWIPCFLFAFAIALAICIGRGAWWTFGFAGAGILSLLIVPILLNAQLISVDVAPALFLLVTVAIALSWSIFRQSYRVRGTINPASGLLNLEALREDSGNRDRTLIAARVHNYPQIAATLSPEEEKALVQQIAGRLSLGAGGHALHQGDEGIFAWFSDQTLLNLVGEHLDALHGFFRNSLGVADKQIDLSISFGVDMEVARSLTNRLGSALVASDEAAHEGLKWKAYDPAGLEDAEWKLSLLGQLDRAIDSGDLWVAYQPKLDLASGAICGAEALVRWTHPEKGAISPSDFVLAAEQSDRIEKLTHFVLREAIRGAAAINRQGISCNMAVNLSTRLIGDRTLTPMVRALLTEHGLAPHLLTLEVTETAAVGTGGDDFETLRDLRDLGVQISIDDYGTGLSTLEYLKKIPATEIKIDRIFVAAVTRSPSDRLMVHSTIQLAHSLGKKVVAEGVEDTETLNALADMGCDYAQGFLIDRPMMLDQLIPRLKVGHHRQRKIAVDRL